MVNQELDKLLAEGWPELGSETREKISLFRDLLVAENAIQNLTRLTSPRDFYDGHVLDVKAVLESGLVDYPAMDLGSGGGIPGLLAAVIQNDPSKKWILVDGEGHKARFLREATERLGIAVDVFAGRGEDWLKTGRVATVVARAVGPVDRIYTWIGERSTWNNLVLLKGPGWDEEWTKLQGTRHRRALSIVGSFKYTVGAEEKRRVIIRLARVPRGTNEKTAE